MAEPIEEKLVRDMPYEGKELLSTLLEPNTAMGNNYKLLAAKLGFTTEEIREFETKNYPVMDLLKHRKCLDLTIFKLKDCLLEMERHDVVQDLIPFEMKTLTPSENKRLYEERNKDQANGRITVLPEELKYDAFVCYAKEDLEHAKLTLRILEADPYHLKLCINYRDILPGGHDLTTYVQVIEERCRKVIVLISKHFSKDIDADFQAKIALGLSPGCKEKRLIPIVCDNRKHVPAILRHITHLDYTNNAAREYFWPNLARALGYEG